MKGTVRHLLFNHSDYSLSGVRQVVGNSGSTRDEAQAVLGPDVGRMLDSGATAPQDVPAGKFYKPGEDRRDTNVVVFWGAQNSGRTAVVGTLLCLPGMEVVMPDDDVTSRRISALTEAYSPGKHLLPKFDNSGTVDIYNAHYKRGQKTYALQLVVADPSNYIFTPIVRTAKKTLQNEIHVLCIDCRQDVDKQMAELKKLVDTLKSALKRASAVYVLVTKADRMFAPAQYLDNAAQTLVTTSDFWNQVRNACRKALVFNEQPIVCSVGDFTLRDYACIKHDYVQALLDDYLLPKLRPRRGRVARLMGLGGTAMVAVAVIVATALACLAAYLTFDAIAPPPQGKATPYLYAEHFIAQVQAKLPPPDGSLAYDDLREQYWRLRKDLDIETGLHLRGGGLVLPPDSAKRCDSALSNAFAKILIYNLEGIYNKPDWTGDSALLHDKWLPELNEARDHRHALTADNRQLCDSLRLYFVKYRTTVLPLVDRSTHCQSVDQVARVAAQLPKWNRYPYNNDTSLAKRIREGRANAFNSCAEHYSSMASTLYSDYIESSSTHWWSLNYYTAQSKLMRTKHSAKSYRENVLTLIEQIDSIKSAESEASDIKRLNEARNTLTRVMERLNTIPSPTN